MSTNYMKSIDYADVSKRIGCAIELERKIVGVRFIFTEQEFENLKTINPTNKMSYCKMIVKSSLGESMKVSFNNFSCFAGARALGIVDLDLEFTSGLYYASSGLYQDISTAKRVTSEISSCKHKVYGLEIKPLEEFDVDPHVVIVISNPFNIMRLAQGYSYKYGVNSSIKMIGNQAMCSECTAYPYETNDANFSLLCAGARRSGLDNNEIGVGLTLNKLMGVLEGLYETINPVENNTNKKKIESKIKQRNIPDVNIIYNKNYGDELRKYDSRLFRKKENTGGQ